MEKLRTTYLKYQSEILAPNPRFVSAQKTNKLIKLADLQLQKMRVNQDFTNYDQATFYKQKFSKLSDIASRYEGQKISEQNYHKSARDTVKDNFMNRSVPMMDQNVSFGNNENSGIKQKSKSPLKSFFEQQEIKNSKKINFSSVLGKDETPLKYGLKSVSRSKNESVVRPKNNQSEQQLRRLEVENRRLKQQLNQQKNSNINEDQRLKDLRNRVRQLDDQNRRLKTEVSKSSKTDTYIEEQYEPYNLKIRENNIVKIHNKNLYLSEKMSQFGGLSEDFPKDKKVSQIYYDSQSDYMRPQNFRRLSPTPRDKNWDDDVLNSSQSSIQTQLLNLQNSELYDDTKNQVCRQKIAFFKKSMIIAKGQDFDIAFKRSDFNTQMDKLRLILYINNKETRSFNCDIEYDFDREDFDVIIRKKLQNVQARSQGREEIQICLKNASDLGSLITAKVLVGNKTKKIVVPTMFIEFDNDFKYRFENIGYLERNLTQPLVIKPMSQFSTIERTGNVVQLTRQYEEKYEVGKMYGKSKACKGVVRLTWRHGKLKIQTCEQWRTLIGYLFLNAEETVNY